MKRDKIIESYHLWCDNSGIYRSDKIDQDIKQLRELDDHLEYLFLLRTYTKNIPKKARIRGLGCREIIFVSSVIHWIGNHYPPGVERFVVVKAD